LYCKQTLDPSIYSTFFSLSLFSIICPTGDTRIPFANHKSNHNQREKHQFLVEVLEWARGASSSSDHVEDRDTDGSDSPRALR
jgi:hypothetical protein